MFFFLTQFLQGVHGFSPLKAGLAFLPMTLTMFATVRVRAAARRPRIGELRLLAAGTPSRWSAWRC